MICSPLNPILKCLYCSFVLNTPHQCKSLAEPSLSTAVLRQYGSKGPLGRLGLGRGAVRLGGGLLHPWGHSQRCVADTCRSAERSPIFSVRDLCGRALTLCGTVFLSVSVCWGRLAASNLREGDLGWREICKLTWDVRTAGRVINLRWYLCLQIDAKELNAFIPKELRLSRRTVSCSVVLKIKAPRCVPRKEVRTWSIVLQRADRSACRLAEQSCLYFQYSRDWFVLKYSGVDDCLKETVYFQTPTLVKCFRWQQRATKPLDRIHFSTINKVSKGSEMIPS